MKNVNVYENSNNKGILLNANEMYVNLNTIILDEIKSEISNINFNRYPDSDSTELRKRYAEVYGLDYDEIIAGNGSDEMLGLMIGVFLRYSKKLYTLKPDFSMYNYYASMQDAEVVSYETKEDGSFSIEDFIKQGKDKKIDLILFSNPNNPTGNHISNKDISKIVESFPNIPVIIDEAYTEYACESALRLINKYNNIYITRTLSKAFSLAAARVGFLIGNKDNMKKIREKKVPYNVNSISQIIASIVLKHANEFRDIVEKIKKSRDSFYESCKNGKGYTIYPSQANFIYGRSPYKDKLISNLEDNNITIRSFKDNTFRITMGSEKQNKIVKEILLNLNVEG